MKTARLAILACLSALASGCASFSLPAISAEKFEYRRSDPFGGTVVTAEGVRVDGDKVRATSATLHTQYPAFSVSVKVENYERQKKPGE